LRLVEKALLGRKIGMTQLFGEEGAATAVTVIAAGPCYVVQRKQATKEGYDALQLGYEELPAKRATKPQAGHFRKAAEKSKAEIPICRHLAEFRFADCDAYQVGARLGADVFTVGERVDVTATSKGKGFAGAHKRHGFSGGPASHGSMSHRRPGSSGATDAARTFKGTKKPGHMGNRRTTVKALRVYMIDSERGVVAVAGSVPGPSGGLVMVVSPATSASRSRGEGQ